MICQNCGHENDMDATFCDRCGARLGRDPNFGHRRTPPGKEGTSQTTKILIVAVVILVGILGVTAGMLLQSDKNTISTADENQPSITESDEKVTYKADWHKVTSFSGSGDEYRSFKIRGQQFKVVFSAMPMLNYNTNFMSIDVYDASGIIGSGEVNWGPTDALTNKEKTVKVTGPPGTYTVDVLTKDLESWTVTIYDYY